VKQSPTVDKASVRLENIFLAGIQIKKKRPAVVPFNMDKFKGDKILDLNKEF